MKRIILAALFGVQIAFTAFAQTSAEADAARLETHGQFQQAATLLRTAIASRDTSPDQIKSLQHELERLHWIEFDFGYSRKDLFREMQAATKDLKPDEFETWIDNGWFERRVIDGKERFFTSAVDNFYFRHPELRDRRNFPLEEPSNEKWRLDTITAIKQFAAADKTNYVLPKTIQVTMTVTVNSNVAPDGELIRAWLPIPRRNPFQDDFKLVSTSTKPVSIDSPKSVIRSIYLEQPAVADKPTEFKLEYEYTIYGVHFDLHPEIIGPINVRDTQLQQFTAEAPHVVFTPEIQALSAKIVGDETNPMLRAKKIYDWLCDNLYYSYSLEYATIRNISDSCRANGYGDCGQQALLFITLCRYNGVPARWQTGWDLTPHSTSIHDWTEIYLEPYGWVPVDPYMGNYAMRYTTTLSREDKLAMRDFYFGGLDQYRMIANSDHDQLLNPPKKALRSDDVDFQRAELEHGGKNIYFDQFSYKLDYKILPTPAKP